MCHTILVLYFHSILAGFGLAAVAVQISATNKGDTIQL